MDQSRDPAAARGLALAAKGRFAEALPALETALAHAPDDLDVLFALGNTARALGLAKAAERFFGEVLKRRPRQIEAIVNLANLWRSRGHLDGAIALLREALARDPAEAVLWNTIGCAARELGDRGTALSFFQEAVRLDPASAEALGNLADLTADGGDLEGALKLHEAARRRAPRSAQLALNRAVLRLAAGDLGGFEDYEARLRIPGAAPEFRHRLRRWSGGRMKGRAILIAAEQGLGDQILFSSLMPKLAEEAARHSVRVLMDCEPRLAALFARSFPAITVHPWALHEEAGTRVLSYGWLDQAGGADLWCPIGSLAAALCPAIEDFPASRGHLTAEPAQAGRWRDWRRALGTGPVIGVSWRSGRTLGLRAAEYAPLEAWAGLLQQSDARFVMAQYDARDDEIAALEALSGRRLHVPPGLDQKHDIEGAAAMLSVLDAVVSAPTAVAALAGGVGTPVAQLVATTSWTSLGEARNPYLPAVEIIRPERAGDWTQTMAAAARWLSRFG